MAVDLTVPGPCTYLDFLECHLAGLLWKTFTPLLLVIGICGNTISIAVWSRKRMRKTTTSVYLRFLAAIDTSVLLICPLREFIFFTTDLDIQEIGHWSCRIHTWLAFSVSALSGWILAVLAIDRLLAVKFPVWTKSKCSSYHAVIIGVSVSVAVFLINIHVLLYLNKTEERIVSNVTNRTVLWDITCWPTSEFNIFWFQLWPIIVLLLFCFAPGICLITCGFLLIKELSLSNNNRQSFRRVRNLSGRSITKMLITICLFFLVISTPVSVYLIVNPYIFDNHLPLDMARRMLTWAVVDLLLYCNNAFNFVLYCVSGSLFRRELSLMFQKLRKTISMCRERQVSPAEHGITGQRCTGPVLVSKTTNKAVPSNTCKSESANTSKSYSGNTCKSDSAKAQSET